MKSADDPTTKPASLMERLEHEVAEVRSASEKRRLVAFALVVVLDDGTAHEAAFEIGRRADGLADESLIAGLSQAIEAVGSEPEQTG